LRNWGQQGYDTDDNAGLIENAEMKYFSALIINQIPPSGVNLKPFKWIHQ